MLVVKKTQIYLYVSILFLLLGCSISDGDSPNPEDTFVKYYGVSGTQVGIDLEYDAASNGVVGESMVILGSLIPSGETDRDVVVYRVDLAGNEINSVQFDFTDRREDGNGGGDDEPGSILVEDDGFVVVGSSSRNSGGNPYTALFVAILDEQLQVTDSIVIEEVGFNIKGMDVIRAMDGTLIVTGSSNFEEDGDPFQGSDQINNEETQIFIAKLDFSSREVVWRRTRGFPGDDEGIYIDEFSENNFVIIGTSDKERASQGQNVILLPINEFASPNDGLAEGFTIDGQEDFDDVATAVFKRPSGYVITGISSKPGATNRPFFINFTYTSTEAVTMDLGREILPETEPNRVGNGYGIALGRNGNYFVVGEYLAFNEGLDAQDKNSEILVTQLDQSGNDIEGTQRNYGLVAGSDIGEDIHVLANGDILVLTTVDFGSGSTLMGLMRLNQDGDIAQ